MSCIFCKIIKGELPSFKVYEDDCFVGILDISPSSPGHALLVSKEHSANIFESRESAFLADAFPAAKRLGEKLKATLDCDGMNILQNNGAAAGQTVEHFHVHLIPRYSGDKVKIEWEHDEPDMSALKILAEKIGGEK